MHNALNVCGNWQAWTLAAWMGTCGPSGFAWCNGAFTVPVL